MDNEHIVKAYDDELSQLDNLIAEMGGLCEVQLSQAVEARVKGDVELASRVIDNDKIIATTTHFFELNRHKPSENLSLIC